MERLLEIARKHASQADVYSLDYLDNNVSFENAKLKDIDSKIQSGIALRLFKDGKVGTAYTRNLIDREGLVQNALASLKGGVEAAYDLPLTVGLPALASYDSAIERLTNAAIVDECTRVCDYVAARTKGQVNTFGGSTVVKLRVLNSQGTNLRTEVSSYGAYVQLSYPGTYSSVSRMAFGKSFMRLPDGLLDYVVDTYNRSVQEAKCKSGKMKVLFMPEAMYALVWRLTEATSARNFYEKTSPLCDKLGQPVLSERLTIVDQALDDKVPGARAFDDEGTPCRNLPIFEKGILRNFYCDLYYAAKLGVKSTGNGYKGEIQFKPHPELSHLTILPGDKSFPELVRMLDHGMIVGGAMGAHSGNILNGDYSIGMSPGILVEGGEIKGQVKDAMVAGNVYETMKNVIAVENANYPAPMGRFPAILFDNVSVATRD
jgi:PmbA protein